VTWFIPLLPYFISTLLSLILAAFAIRRRATPGSLAFATFMLFEASYTLGYVFELEARSLAAKIAWDSFQYVGAFGAALSMVAIAKRYVGRPRTGALRWAPAFVVPLVVTAVSLTDGWHHLMRKSAHIVPDPPFGALWYDFVWLDYLAIAYFYACFVVSVAILAKHWRHGNRLARLQTTALILGTLMPVLLSSLFVFVVNPFKQRDPAPFSFLLGGLILGWGLFRARLFRLVPIAREAVIEHMADGVVAVDGDGCIVDANPAAARVLGRPLPALIGGRLGEVAQAASFHLPDDASNTEIAQRLQGPGTERWYAISVHVLLGPLRSASGRLYVFRDVTAARQREQELREAKDLLEFKVEERTRALLLEIEQRKRTEDELAQSERRFRAIFDQAFQLVGLLDLRGTVLDANRSSLDMIGARLDDVVGRPFWETPWWRGSPDEPHRLKAAIKAAAGGQFVRYETTHQVGDGSLRHIDFSLKPVRDEHGRVTTLIPEGRDITELRHSEEERLRLSAQLNQSQRLEALGRLAGGVAHDFNNLLTVIAGNTSLLLASPLCEQDRESAQEIVEAAQRAGELTRQLLAFGRRQAIEPVVFDAAERLGELHKLLPRVVGEDVAIDVAPSDEPGCLFMDPSQFDQIVMNLVVNARDAMPQGGRLDIALERVEVQAAQEPLRGPPQPGSYLVLTVRDSGVGIAEDVLAHVFEPFFTTKPAGTGTGLGLATVHGIVAHAEGAIVVDSIQGRGTTFKVYLPRSSDLPPQGGTGAEPLPMTERKVFVLLVEDQESVRNLIVRMLSQRGLEVTAFPDGAAALAHVSSGAGKFDVVLTDVVMPGMGGRELADHIRPLFPGVPIVFMSGHPDDTVLRHGIEEAREYFLAKPFTPAALFEKLVRVIDRAGQGLLRPNG
jgi:PAS domain S-box-containing protein